MMEYDHQCNMDPTIPPKYPCTHYNIHLATLVIINLCPVLMSQSGDIIEGMLHFQWLNRTSNVVEVDQIGLPDEIV